MYPEWVVIYRPPNDMSKCLFIMLGTLLKNRRCLKPSFCAFIPMFFIGLGLYISSLLD